MKHGHVTSLVQSDIAESARTGVQAMQPESRTHIF